MKQTIWIVGASSGIGLELTRRWLNDGHRIIASSRNATKSSSLLELKQNHQQNLVLIDLDVTQTSEEITERVNQSWNTFGGIDRWFYNAGAYEMVDFDSWNIDTFEQMNTTNYLGVVRLMIPLSKKFAEQGGGEWVWNISLSSYFGLPYGGAYSAPKAALVNLAESIQPELKRKGIVLRIINHGFVKTKLTQKNDFEMPQLMEPSQAAQKIATALENENGFEIRFPKTLSYFLAFMRHVPYRFSLWLSSKALR